MKNVKVLLLGDSNVGKSTFLHKFIKGEYKTHYELTVGIDYGTKIINYKNEKVKIHIWDTAGQEAFRAITKSYYRDTDGMFLFFDLSDVDSFNNVSYWMNTYTEVQNNKQIVIVGNKNELSSKINVLECKKLEDLYGVKYIDISLKYDDYEIINNLIFSLLDLINIDTLQETTVEKETVYDLENQQKQKNGLFSLC